MNESETGDEIELMFILEVDEFINFSDSFIYYINSFIYFGFIYEKTDTSYQI